MIRFFASNAQGYEFYGLMGEFFASLDIAKELERQVYNKPDTDWYVIDYDHDIAGFVSVHDAGNHYFIDNLYVLPQYRNNRWGKDLIASVCADYTDKPLRCIACNPHALRIFEEFGFVEVGTRGKYKRLEKH